MEHVIHRLLRKYFSDPEGVILALLLVAGFAIIIFMGDMLAPVLASITIAYLLEGLIAKLERAGLGRMPAVLIVYLPFLAFVGFLVLGLLPLLIGQVKDLLKALPAMLTQGQQALERLPEVYPSLVSPEQIDALMNSIRSAIGQLGQYVVTLSLASISSVFTFLVYVVLVPVLVFFFLKDKDRILSWLLAYLPRERRLMSQVWEEMDNQIGNYVRGKFTEILIVGVVTYIMFVWLGLNYAMLLGALVGLSVIIPYIGVIAVAVPVALIAYFQWGFTSEFAWVMAGFAITQALDGNLLVPWLFSEAVNMHPVAIILAVLVFGGLWGFWGVFFAIPLATLVMAIMHCWPRTGDPVEA